MKRKLAAVLCSAIIFTSVLAPVSADVPKFNYTFEQATKMALDNSVEYKKSSKAISAAYDAYDALDNVTPQKVSFNVVNFDKFIEQQVKPVAALEQVYSKYQLAILQKKSIEKNLQISLRQAVIDVQNNENTVKEADIQKGLKKNELKALEARYSVGLISSKDYKSQKLAIDKTLEQLDRADKALELAYRKLNNLLGREDERDVVVHLNDTLIPLEKLDLKLIKEDLKKYDASLTALDKDKFVNWVSFSLIDEKYQKYNLDKLSEKTLTNLQEYYDEYQEDNNLAEKTYNDAAVNLEKSITDLIENIQNTYIDIESIKSDIIDENENQDVYKIKFDLGQMSKLEYDARKANITLLEDKLQSTELDLNMKYAKLLIWSDLNKVVKK